MYTAVDLAQTTDAIYVVLAISQFAISGQRKISTTEVGHSMPRVRVALLRPVLAVVCWLQARPPVAAAAPPTIPKTMRHVVAQDIVGTGHGCKAPYNPTCFDVLRSLTPKPGPLEVLVKMSSASVNPSDLDLEQQVGRLEGTLGVDFAGEVVALGPGPHSLKVGDQVWGVTKGSYADYTLAGDAQTGLVPSGLNMSVAGTIPEVGATSLQCLYALGARNGGWVGKNLTVVITSGTGGTGFIGVQLAKALGAGRVITSTSGAANIALAESLGASQGERDRGFTGLT
jgi:NADPH-dependent curcumin reductase CurA